MFNSKKKQREAMANLISSYKPTSKSSLKSFCIMASNGNVEEAEKLYNFYIKDMEELPMFDPVPPTAMDNAKNIVTGIFDFVRENREGIEQVTDLVRGFIGKRGAVAETAVEALPPING